MRTLPDVCVAAPVPPRATDNVPEDILDAFNDVSPDPLPVIVLSTINVPYILLEFNFAIC
jgi:hypothetical protein